MCDGCVSPCSAAPLHLCKTSTPTQVEKSKLLIREAIKACEDAGGTAAIPESAYDANGELHIKDIFCCICSGREELQVRAMAALVRECVRRSPLGRRTLSWLSPVLSESSGCHGVSCHKGAAAVS